MIIFKSVEFNWIHFWYHMEEIHYMFEPVPSQYLDIQRHMSWFKFLFLHFWCHVEEINYMFEPVPSQHLDIQRHMSWLFFLHFWCHMEEINYMFAPVPSQHLDIQSHMSLSPLSSVVLGERWLSIFVSYIAKIVEYHCLNSLYNNVVWPVICEGWCLTQMWKALAWPHHYPKRGDLGQYNEFNPATFYWSACKQARNTREYVFMY